MPKVNCPRCKGTGVIVERRPPTVAEPEPRPKEIPCPDCGGTGKVRV